MYVQNLDLDLIPEGVRPVIHVSQYDNQANALRFSLFVNNQSFTIPSGAGVLINGHKPDNTAFSYQAASISGNVAVCNITQQMTAVPGDVDCELRIRAMWNVNLESEQAHRSSVRLISSSAWSRHL